MCSQLIQIKENIKKWNQIKKIDIAISFLTSGTGFTISRENYNVWKGIIGEEDSNSTLNCYFGVDEFEMEVYLIDSISDRDKNYSDENLIEKELIKSIETITQNHKSNKKFSPITFKNVDNLSNKKAEQRILSWVLSSKEWFKSQLNNYDLPTLITIPFNDLKQAFHGTHQEIAVVFALKEFEQLERLDIELIIIKPDSPVQESTTNEYIAMYDVSKPRPPFTITDDYNLLNHD